MREPHIEAVITCERTVPFQDGFRPAHLIKDDYLTTGVHHYYNQEIVNSGESVLGTPYLVISYS